MRALLLALAVALGTLAAGCSGCDLERMIDQPRFTYYEECTVCPDGTIMMQPPEGTVSRSALLLSREHAQGRDASGAWVEQFPMQVTRPVLERGKNRFDIYCAACHGRLANGVSQVAENMARRPPPNLLAPPYTTDAYPPGRLFAVISEGFGLMRSYAPELTVADRWAVVAYLQALQLAQHVALSDLPPPVQEEARRWLK
jgi:hypothetical protein